MLRRRETKCGLAVQADERTDYRLWTAAEWLDQVRPTLLPVCFLLRPVLLLPHRCCLSAEWCAVAHSCRNTQEEPTAARIQRDIVVICMAPALILATLQDQRL